MTYASVTTGQTNHRLRLYVTIAGVEQVLVEQTLTAIVGTELETRTQLAVVAPGGVQVGESSLDLDRRRQIGGDLTIRLRDTDTNQLRTLFAARTRRTTWVTEEVDKTETGILVSSVTGLTSPVYIGSETITFSGTVASPAELTGCTRGVYSSRAQAHHGAAADGAGVFLQPPAWIGRRVTLKAVYLNDAGSAGSASTDVGTIGTYVLEEAPQFLGGNEWELRCSELSDTYASKRCYVGLVEMKTDDAVDENPLPNDGVITLSAANITQFAAPAGALQTQVRFRLQGGLVTIRTVTAVGLASITIGNVDGAVTPSVFSEAIRATTSIEDRTRYTSLQNVVYLAGDPIEIALLLLLSEYGDAANNATWDLLPGKARTSYGGPEWRFGAAVLAADVDITSFTALQGTAAIPWTHLLDEEVEVGDMLRDLCISVNAYWYVNSSGQLAIARLQDKLPASTAVQSVTITDSNTGLDSDEGVRYDERAVIHSISLQGNWDPLVGKHLATIQVVDWDLMDRFGETAGRVEISSRFISLDLGQRVEHGAQMLRRFNGASYANVEPHLRSMQKASGRGRLYYRATCAWNASQIVPGQAVRVTNARVIDYEGGTLSSDSFLVVGRSLDIEQGLVMLDLMFLDAGVLIAPAQVIASMSTSGGKDSFVLSTTDACARNSAPARDFAVGWSVRAYDISATTPNTYTVDAIISDTEIRMTAAIAWTAEANVDFLYTDRYTSIGTQATAQDSFTRDNFAWQIGSTGAVSGFTSRWT